MTYETLEQVWNDYETGNIFEDTVVNEAWDLYCSRKDVTAHDAIELIDGAIGGITKFKFNANRRNFSIRNHQAAFSVKLDKAMLSRRSFNKMVRPFLSELQSYVGKKGSQMHISKFESSKHHTDGLAKRLET